MTKGIILSLFAIIIVLGVCPHVWGQVLEVQAARVLRIKGTTMVYQYQSKKWSVAKRGMRLFQRDTIKTLSDSQLDLLIEGVAVVRLKEKTTLEIAEIKEEATRPVTSSRILLVEKRSSDMGEKNILRLLNGKLLLWVKHILQGSTFDVETPIGIAGVRGTRFMVRVPDQDTTVVAVLEGIVEVKNIQMPEKTVLVRKMESSIILRGAYPSEPRRVSEGERRDLKETLELKLLREAKGFKRKPGSRYDGMYSSKYVYWEGSGGMVDHGIMSTGSMHDDPHTMGGGSTPMGGGSTPMGGGSTVMGGTNTRPPGDMQSGGGRSKPSKDGHR